MDVVSPNQVHFGFYCARDILNACRALNTTFGETNDINVGLAAVLFGTHVMDWLYFRDLGQTKEGKHLDSFRADYEQKVSRAAALRSIANGTKHPKTKYQLRTDQRPVEWEDDDFWDTAGQDETWFIEIDGKQRAITSLIRNFCNSCDAHLASLGK